METNTANLERFMLRRLERFSRLTRTTGHDPSLRLLARRATLSGYRDCVNLGLEKQALEILGRASR